MGMILISAVAKKNRVIGAGDRLPWRIREEYDHFLAETRGHPVIMGKNTYNIVTGDGGHDYEVRPDSKMFVVSGSMAKEGVKEYRGAEVCASLDEAIERASALDRNYFCAGGASLYKEAIERDLADRMYLSEIEGDWTGTAYFPDFDRRVWKEVRRERHAGWDFVEYVKTSR